MQQQIANVLQILPIILIHTGGFYLRKDSDMGDTRFEPNSFGGNEMKKRSILILVIVLTLAVLTGCGCRNSKPMDTMPTTMPTTEATKATTAPTQATQPSTPTNSASSTMFVTPAATVMCMLICGFSAAIRKPWKVYCSIITGSARRMIPP